jgi:hypothetical protein
VSFSSTEIRIHRGFLDAPDDVLEAVVDFVQAKTRRKRADARRRLIAFKIPSHARAQSSPRRAPEKTHPADESFVTELVEWHSRLNREKFAGGLGPVPIRVSRRLKSRLRPLLVARAGGSSRGDCDQPPAYSQAWLG